jgi:hypothetical protein
MTQLADQCFAASVEKSEAPGSLRQPTSPASKPRCAILPIANSCDRVIANSVSFA